MLKYAIKRILTFIPMLIAISLISFIISINAPGDPVARMTQAGEAGSAQTGTSSTEKEKEEKRRELGLHLPIFYFSFSNYATPKDLHKVSSTSEKENLTSLIHQYGNWESIYQYYLSIKSAETFYQRMVLDAISDKDDFETFNQIGMSLNTLLEENKQDIIEQNINLLSKNILSLLKKNAILIEDNGMIEFGGDKLFSHFVKIKKNHNKLKSTSQKWKTYIPTMKFYGSDNQYHLWLFGNGEKRSGIFRGDFGDSYNDGKPIKDKIWDRVGISFALSIISILIAYLVSIPLGIYSAYKKDSITDRGISLVLFILYSLQSFFIGTLLLLWFANTNNFYWFPESGIQNPITWDANWRWWEWEALKHRIPYLILPLITYTYGSFAFLSRIMRIGMIDVVGQDYIRTARAKGLSERTVILKHALRNSLLPIITVFAAVFPLSVGGSIIIEVIFTIPGMGLEIFNAIQNQDYPMIIAFFTLAGFLTMIGYLVSDILYAMVDPRISYK